MLVDGGFGRNVGIRGPIPSDLLHVIMQQIEFDASSLLACSRVCRLWNGIASLYINRHVKPKTFRSLQQFLSRNDSKASSIRTIDLSSVRMIIPAKDLDRMFCMVFPNPMSRITLLDLKGVRNIQDDHIQKVAMAKPPLRVLRLSRNRMITDAALMDFFQHIGSNMKVLWIDECSEITNATMQSVAQYCSRLAELKLSSLHRVSDDGMALIADGRADCCQTGLEGMNSFKLQHLCLGEMPTVSDNAIQRLYASDLLKQTPLQTFPLRSLTLCHSYYITDSSLQRVLVNCHLLETLDLGIVDGITAASLHTAARFCLTLRHLVVSGNLRPASLNLRKVPSPLFFSNAEHLGSQLNFRGQNVLPADHLLSIVKEMKMLQSLTLFQSWDFSEEHAKELVLSCPGLKKLYLKQCRMFSPAPSGVHQIERCHVYINTDI
ncbi:hypothetical protein HDU97_002904 [Phlyctochytrium planicorne]|nr:hypothetical protein HDU97_002904 [Phlyctochytrium planicorne]